MEEIENPEKKSSKFRIVMLVFVLIVMPLGSVYYLYTGRAHHRETVAELEKLGVVANVELKDQSNVDISTEGLRGKVTVVQFLPKDLLQAKPLADRISQVHQSFDETEDVQFLSYIVQDTAFTLREIAEKLGMEDPKQWHLLGTTEEDWQRIAKQVYLVQDPLNTVAMVDTSLTIRKMYDINDNPQMGRMVEHIAKVVPKQKRR